MAGPSRSKNGVASLAYGAGHPRLGAKKDVDGRVKTGHTAPSPTTTVVVVAGFLSTIVHFLVELSCTT